MKSAAHFHMDARHQSEDIDFTLNPILLRQGEVRRSADEVGRRFFISYSLNSLARWVVINQKRSTASCIINIYFRVNAIFMKGK